MITIVIFNHSCLSNSFSGTTAINFLNSVDIHELYSLVYFFLSLFQAPPVMAYPATTPTGMIGYGIPPQMGSVPVMTQPTLIYSQPVMRPPNPFGPVSGAQIQFM